MKPSPVLNAHALTESNEPCSDREKHVNELSLFCCCFRIFLLVFSLHPRELAESLDYSSFYPKNDFWDRKDFSSLNIRPYSSPELDSARSTDRRLGFLTSRENTHGRIPAPFYGSVKYFDELGGSFFLPPVFSFLNPCTGPLSSQKRSPKISHDLQIHLLPSPFGLEDLGCIQHSSPALFLKLSSSLESMILLGPGFFSSSSLAVGASSLPFSLLLKAYLSGEAITLLWKQNRLLLSILCVS